MQYSQGRVLRGAEGMAGADSRLHRGAGSDCRALGVLLKSKGDLRVTVTDKA